MIRGFFTARSRLIRCSGRCCRRAAASRMRWRRWRSLRGRGCCGSGQRRCGRSSVVCRRAGCYRATRVPSRQGRCELRSSRARYEQERGEMKKMDVERRREIGLFRYALVRDLADRGLSKAERGRLVRALAEREHLGPDGRLVRVARGTLTGGFARTFVAGLKRSSRRGWSWRRARRPRCSSSRSS